MDKFTLGLPDGYQKDTPVLVAFSGGADSSLLLHLLHGAGFRLYAVHVHHGIRADAADADLAFCRRICKQLGIPLFAVKVNVPVLAKKAGQSLEEAARHARYRHFARLMRTHGIPLLATAHHADDNLETVLFRLCRGTGTQGLRGIPAYAPLPDTDGDGGLFLFRPMLHLTKEEILTACEQRGIPFVTDATNACDDYARNRIRNRVIPELEALFPHPQHAAARLCRAASEDCLALDGMAQQLMDAHALQSSISTAVLREQPAAICKRLISLLYSRYASNSGQKPGMPEAVHIDAIYERLCKGAPGSISLPGNIAAVIDHDRLYFTEDKKSLSPILYNLPARQGLTEIFAAGVAIRVNFPQNQKTDTRIDTNVYNLYTELQVRFDTIKGQAFLRPIRQGDVILCGGMHKRIRKLYGERHVPQHLRARLPLLCDDEGVIAVPGICVRDGAAPTPKDRSVSVSVFLAKSF